MVSSATGRTASSIAAIRSSSSTGRRCRGGRTFQQCAAIRRCPSTGVRTIRLSANYPNVFSNCGGGTFRRCDSIRRCSIICLMTIRLSSNYPVVFSNCGAGLATCTAGRPSSRRESTHLDIAEIEDLLRPENENEKEKEKEKEQAR